ncbi:hypothetical protein GCM10027172_17380 [Halomonas garicola]
MPWRSRRTLNCREPPALISRAVSESVEATQRHQRGDISGRAAAAGRQRTGRPGAILLRRTLSFTALLPQS